MPLGEGGSPPPGDVTADAPCSGSRVPPTRAPCRTNRRRATCCFTACFPDHHLSKSDWRSKRLSFVNMDSCLTCWWHAKRPTWRLAQAGRVCSRSRIRNGWLYSREYDLHSRLLHHGSFSAPDLRVSPYACCDAHRLRAHPSTRPSSRHAGRSRTVGCTRIGEM
jgi:hypothetical protein